MLLTGILFLIFISVFFLAFMVVPKLYDRATIASLKSQQKMSGKMELLMSRSEAKKISRILVFTPILFAGLFFLVFPSELRIPGVVLGVVGGIVFPGIYIKILTQRTRDKFSDQLVDALMIMSSSFRGGLSLVQALEAVVDEMPDPINREFGIVLGENKMGVSLDEAMAHLYSRMPMTSLQQMITAILLARETGGNLPVIFNRIVANIREAKKIQGNLKTLTVQGKIQGFVMSILPIGFLMLTYSANPRIYINMLHSDLGRTLLIAAVFLETLGAFFIWKISSFSDF